MDGAEVALAAIALVGSILGLVVTPLFKLLKDQTKANLNLNNSIKDNSKATKDLQKSVNKLYELGTEQHLFMKNLNGKLAKATIQTVEEQKVRHQTVEHSEHKEV